MKTKTISDEQLSAYLDDELDAGERELFERRLEDSPEARRRLAELREVVSDLRSLERQTPPEELYHRLARRLVLDAEPGALEEKLARRRSRYLSLQSTVWTLLAVVLALAVFIVLLARAWERPTSTATSEVEGSAGAVQLKLIGDRAFELHADGWQERGLSTTESRRVRFDSAEGQHLLARLPWLAELWRDAEVERVTLAVDGEVVTLIRPAGPTGG